MTRTAPQKTIFARRLRTAMTDAERLLWRHLRMRQFDGFKFRRQHLADEYILDFVCLEASLAIEVDGGQHSEQMTADAVRSKKLQELGFEVLRFWNHEVLQDIESVKAVIWGKLQTQNPHPGLPPKRGKE